MCIETMQYIPSSPPRFIALAMKQCWPWSSQAGMDGINSLDPGRYSKNFTRVIPTHIIDKVHEYCVQNCCQVKTTEHLAS